MGHWLGQCNVLVLLATCSCIAVKTNSGTSGQQYFYNANTQVHNSRDDSDFDLVGNYIDAKPEEGESDRSDAQLPNSYGILNLLDEKSRGSEPKDELPFPMNTNTNHIIAKRQVRNDYERFYACMFTLFANPDCRSENNRNRQRTELTSSASATSNAFQNSNSGYVPPMRQMFGQGLFGRPLLYQNQLFAQHVPQKPANFYPFNQVSYPEQQNNRRPGSTSPSTTTTTTTTVTPSTTTTTKKPDIIFSNIMITSPRPIVAGENCDHDHDHDNQPHSDTNTNSDNNQHASVHQAAIHSIMEQRLKRIKKLEEENGALSSEIKSSKSQIESLKTQNKYLQEAVSSLQADNSKLKQRSSQLETTNDHLQRQNGQLQHSVGDQKATIEELNSKVKYLEEKAIKLSMQSSGFSTEQERHQQVETALKNRIRDLVHDVSDCRNEVYQLQLAVGSPNRLGVPSNKANPVSEPEDLELATPSVFDSEDVDATTMGPVQTYPRLDDDSSVVEDEVVTTESTVLAVADNSEDVLVDSARSDESESEATTLAPSPVQQEEELETNEVPANVVQKDEFNLDQVVPKAEETSPEVVKDVNATEVSEVGAPLEMSSTTQTSSSLPASSTPGSGGRFVSGIIFDYGDDAEDDRTIGEIQLGDRFIIPQQQQQALLTPSGPSNGNDPMRNIWSLPVYHPATVFDGRYGHRNQGIYFGRN